MWLWDNVSNSVPVNDHNEGTVSTIEYNTLTTFILYSSTVELTTVQHYNSIISTVSHLASTVPKYIT